MLQLLLEGGQGYEDIGSLLGITPDEVRSRSRQALTEMGGADPDAQVGLTDFLLGQADPIGRADAVRHLQNDPEANALAERLLAQLRLLAPRAELPEIPAARGGRRASPTPAPSPAPTQAPPAPAPSAVRPEPAAPKGPGIASRISGFFAGLGGRLGGGDKRRTQMIVAGACGLVLLVTAGVVIASSGGDDGGDGGDCNTIDTAAAEQSGVPTIELKAAGAAADADCPPSGQATLAPVQASQGQQGGAFALQINAADLEPTSDGAVYVLWLYNSDDQALPLGQQTTNADGELTGGIPLAPQQVLLLAAFNSIRLARASAADAQGLQQVLQQSLRKQSGRPVPFVGETALEGAVSELGLEDLLRQAQAQAQGGGGAGGNAGQGGGSGQ